MDRFGGGGVLSNGQWAHDGRAESYDDGDWIYLGGGVWEDAYLSTLPPDARGNLINRYAAVLDDIAETPDQTMPGP